jgi:hypothetical protein
MQKSCSAWGSFFCGGLVMISNSSFTLARFAANPPIRGVAVGFQVFGVPVCVLHNFIWYMLDV